MGAALFSGTLETIYGIKQCNNVSKAIPLTGRGSLEGCKMLRTPHCLDNRLRDGSKAVSPTLLPSSTLQIHYFSASGTYLCYEAE
jgi:hypothetical protein